MLACMVIVRAFFAALFGACLCMLLSVHSQTRASRSARAPVHRFACQSAHLRGRPHRPSLPRVSDALLSAWEVVSPTGVSVIDVAPGVSAEQLPQLLHLRADEHVVSVDDHPVADDLAAGIALGQLANPAHGRGYIDLTVGDRGGTRRVLLLMR